MTAGYRIRRGGRRPRRVRAAGTAVAALLTLAGCGTAGYGAPVAPASDEGEKRGVHLRYAGAALYLPTARKSTRRLTGQAPPAGTKSLALIVDDSSAPITPFIYWLVFDINPGATDIQEDSLPTGARQAMNSADTSVYDAPCPGSHPHSYRFTVYALNKTLALPNGAPLLSVWHAIAAATIGRGRIVVSTSP